MTEVVVLGLVLTTLLTLSLVCRRRYGTNELDGGDRCCCIIVESADGVDRYCPSVAGCTCCMVLRLLLLPLLLPFLGLTPGDLLLLMVVATSILCATFRRNPRKLWELLLVLEGERELGEVMAGNECC